MKIDQLLSFKRVADERSYTRAAEKSYLTQPAIYSQVRQLETECNVKLFYVSGKEVLLTTAGHDLYVFAETVAAAYEEFNAASRDHAFVKDHQVRIAALSYFGVLSAATERLRAEDPGCVVSFQSYHPSAAMELIRTGEMDFGFFGAAFRQEGFTFEQCDENEIIAVVPPGHMLAGTNRRFSELAEFPLVGYASGSARIAIDTWLAAHPQQKIRYSAQTDSSFAVKTMAIALGSPALIVRQAIVDDLTTGTLVEVPLNDFSASYPLFMVFLGEEQLGASARRYRAHLQGIWRTRKARAPSTNLAPAS